ncbi:O-antigen translocase [Pseudomonas sp. A-R-26]|uniref:O-antigen translocase n=1 Tax=Pseudomonas sp. A-R-26 TaxID=2832404 RepID=UPI001CBB9F09|nr:O-antigen translocase [Pseudomonas sp. A-R-26]
MSRNECSDKLQYRKAVSSAVLTTLAQASKIVVGFLILKLIALYLGPDGLGKLGHFMSLTSILALLAGGGITHGVIKYSAEYRNDKFNLYRLLSTASAFAFVFSVFFALLFLLFSHSISVFILGDGSLAWVISLLSIFQFVLAFNMLFSSVANGLADVKSFAFSQIVGNLISLPFAWFLILKFGLPGAAIAIISILAMAVFPSIYLYLRSSLRFRFRRRKIDSLLLKKLGWFSLMLCVSAIAFPVVEIYIRQNLISNSGYTQAGIWQGLIRLSSAYLGFFSVFLASYFMPMISRIDNKKEIEQLTHKFVVFVMAVFAVGGGTLYFGRDFFVPLLLSKEFEELNEYLLYQLIGDFFKASNYVIGFVAVARAATRIYIVSEIFQAGLFVSLSLLVGQFIVGAEGVTVAYMMSYIMCFLVSILALKFWVRN